MKFRGTLHGQPCTLKDRGFPDDTTLEFTKSQIIFPDHAKDIIFNNVLIQHGKYYDLEPRNNIDRNYRYYIKVGDDKIRVIVDKANEMKLKWIHGLYPVQKNATYANVVSTLTLLGTLIIGMIQLRGC